MPGQKDPKKKQAKVQWKLRRQGFTVPETGMLGESGRAITFSIPTEFPLVPAGDRSVAQGVQHWFSTGGRNIGGRVRSLAIHPTNRDILLAGAASGGIYRTSNRGRTWESKWFDHSIISVASICFSESDPNYVYAATGEIDVEEGASMFRSRDAGETWEAIGALVLQTVIGPLKRFPEREVEVIAVHPTRRGLVYAAAGGALMRSENADAPDPSAVTWELVHLNGFSDIVFAPKSGTAWVEPFFMFVTVKRSLEGDIFRVADPHGSRASVSGQLDDSLGPIPTQRRTIARLDEGTARAKLAVSRTNPDLLFAVFTAHHRANFNRDGETALHTVVRCTAPRIADFSTTTWELLPNHEEFRHERQGSYNLTLAVSPTNPDHLALGMIDIWLCRNAGAPAANVRWDFFTNWYLDRENPAHHSDQHAIVFERNSAPDPPAIWIANDGGVMFNDDYHRASVTFPPGRYRAVATDLRFVERDFVRQMVDPKMVRWEKRSTGLGITQMYDLTQSPLVPSMYGYGLQDMGTWYTRGGPTFDFIMGADGAFVAFHPEDPYRLTASYYGGVTRGDHPRRFHLDVLPPPDQWIGWTIEPARLTQNFRFVDESLFAPDTLHSPRDATRVLTCRNNRLYQTRDGEVFEPVQVGNRIELIATYKHAQNALASTVPEPGRILMEIRPTAGAVKLGLLPSAALSTNNQTENSRAHSPPPLPPGPTATHATYQTSIRGLFSEPFSLADGDTLEIFVTGRDRNRTARVGGSSGTSISHTYSIRFDAMTDATAARVAQYIQANIGNPAASGGASLALEALPTLSASSTIVEIVTNSVGTSAKIEITGDAAEDLLVKPTTSARAYLGAAGSPASIALHAMDIEGFLKTRLPPDFAYSFVTERSTPLGTTLSIKIDDRPTRSVNVASLSDLQNVRGGELAKVIRHALREDPVRVEALGSAKAFIIRALGDFDPVATGTAIDRLTGGNIPAGTADFVLLPAKPGVPARASTTTELIFLPRPWGAYNLEPDPFELELVVVGAALVTITFDAGHYVDRARATVEEVVNHINEVLAATPGHQLSCHLVRHVWRGSPTEATYSARDPQELWIGSDDGRIYRSLDDGATWTDRTHPLFLERNQPVEAIELHPAEPDIAWAGLSGRQHGASDPGFLFKTRNGGRSWSHVGSSITDRTGVLVGINQIVVDPKNPSHLYVATDAGVFRSTDGGDHFEPFSRGLPTCKVMDLAFEPATRQLRAGLWGRGCYTFDLGEPATAPRLYLRTSVLDEGKARPAPNGPDLFSFHPRQMTLVEPPDIKVLRSIPSGELDGAELDALAHEPPDNSPLKVVVQVHNRSAIAPPDLRIVVLWAPVDRGRPPPLSSLENHGSWMQIADQTFSVPRFTADTPHVAVFDWTPGVELEPHLEIAILAAVSSTADPYITTESDVLRLIDKERKLALRITETKRASEIDDVFLEADAGRTLTFSGTAAARFSFTMDVPNLLARSATGPFDLSSVPHPRTLVITDDGAPPRSATITFDADSITASELRARLRIELYRWAVAARVILPRSRLSVQPHAGATRVLSPSGTRHAEIVVAASTPDDMAFRTASLRNGRLTAGSNQVFLRITHAGLGVDGPIDWKIYRFDPKAKPLTIAAADEIGSGQILTMRSGTSQIVNATFTPPANTPLLGLLAVVTSPTETRPDVLREFPSVGELHRIISVQHANAGYRLFEV